MNHGRLWSEDSEWEGELADRTCIYPLGTHSGEKERTQLRRQCLGDGKGSVLGTDSM